MMKMDSQIQVAKNPESLPLRERFVSYFGLFNSQSQLLFVFYRLFEKIMKNMFKSPFCFYKIRFT